MPLFCWYELRTTDPLAARRFYVEAVGLVGAAPDATFSLRPGEPAVGEFAPLPARAAAQGAPAHWLGHVGVADVADAVGRFVALGATQLGPTQTRADGTIVAPLRDPLGAVFAVTSRAAPATAALAWHDLHTDDHTRASAIYRSMFAWEPTQLRDLGPALGDYQEFAWHAGGGSVGGMSSAARRPEIHPHWLFYFPVADVDAALARVRAGGGRVLSGPSRTPGGARVAQCEDPQGAVFALHEA
ncbi:VOC family protein [Nannocystis pusilla]|uniref:VOC family protein n=1 Tax=Nannocystis pusilla TaxID=889268 RepID=A0ABS7TNW5_9BACT|nr:VOC family protein [Nannocystis pusilla]MBZ5709895.1 VOC family protein [Nannocystis pusilla]